MPRRWNFYNSRGGAVFGPPMRGGPAFEGLCFAARMDDLNLLAKLLRSIERIPHILLSDWIAWVDEEADQRRRGHQVVQKADLLCRESSKQRGQAGGVAPGTVHACDEAARDWILAGKENNRDITSGALCSARRRRARSEDCNPATGQ